MDPLSVSAAIIGILTAAAKVTSFLTGWAQSSLKAPKLAQDVLAEVSDITRCLCQLQAYVQGTKAMPRPRASLLMVEQVVVTLTGCVSNFSELEAILGRLAPGKVNGAIDRLKWASKTESIAKILQRLQFSKASLNLMLSTLTCTSIDEAQESVRELNNLVHQVLQSNQELSKRLQNLETHAARPVASGTSSYQSINPTLDDDMTTRSSINRAAKEHTITQTTTYGFSFDEDLQASRVYNRTALRESRLSLPTGLRSFGWSCISGVSLADISNISVISLPIEVRELWNSKHYNVAFNPTSQQLLTPCVPGHSSTSSRPVRISLLGACKSGKSTILRQCQLSSGDDLAFYKTIDASWRIQDCISTSCQDILEELNDSGIDFEYNYPIQLWVSWMRSDVQKAFWGMAKKAIPTNLPYYMDNISRLSQTNYIPSQQDILRSYFPSTGIYKFPFHFDGRIYKIYDTAGQERGKWPRIFTEIDHIVFVVSILGYNTPDDSGKNHMEDSLLIFESLLKLKVLTKVPVTLVLTGIDMLKEKLEHAHISEYFPDYRGGSDPNMACHYFANRFQALCPNRPIGVITTDATDMDAFPNMFKAIVAHSLPRS